MFGFLKKAKIGKTEEEKRAESLPMTKKVQFEPLTIAETEQQLEQDIRAVLGFTPVNYYATKNRYLLCTFFYALNCAWTISPGGTAACTPSTRC